mmetsp:Transcript_22296/g.39720  ORF Transcript_22296/g.39720 Transcript_22296/m.39720 type:complete len:351 (-) Transcript_22296:691-1743(-)
MNPIVVTPLLLLSAASHIISVESLAIPTSSSSTPILAPEVHPTHLTHVSKLVSSALGDIAEDDSTVFNRYASARTAVDDFQAVDDDDGTETATVTATAMEVVPSNELVYGELSVPVLATILDAVGVQDEDVFLDIGSGDGALVLGASLLYAPSNEEGGDKGSDDDSDGSIRRNNNNAIRKAWGVDIVPGLVDRAKVHAKNLERILSQAEEEQQHRQTINPLLGHNQSDVQFLLGDIHTPDDELRNVLQETTLAVCFATTWSAGNGHINNDDVSDKNDDNTRKTKTISTSLQGRKLPKLSKALSSKLAPGCRVVLIDGKLNERDGFSWQGDLRIQCPDTAPYSVATLYYKQ